MSRGWLFTILLVAVCGSCLAQAPLTLDDCLRLAAGAASPADIARLQLAASEQGVREATADFLPLSRLSNAYAYNSPLRGTNNQFSFISLNGVRQYTSQYTLIQELDVSGRLRAGLARAQAEREGSAARFRMAERDLKLAVKRTYYDVLRAQHQLRALEQILLEAEAFERRAEALEKGGEVARSDVARARVQVGAAQLAVQAAQLELRQVENELLAFWTTDMDTRPALEDVFTRKIPPPDDLAGPASYSGRPEFTLLRAARSGFEAEAKRARAALFPQPALVFQYGIDSLHFTGRDRGYAAFVNLNVPVFDWGKALAAERRAKLQASQVSSETQVVQRSMARELANVRLALRTRFDQTETAEQQAKNAAESLRLAKLRYAGGEGNALEVVDSQNALGQAQLSYFLAIRNYLVARAEMEVASGK